MKQKKNEETTKLRLLFIFTQLIAVQPISQSYKKVRIDSQHVESTMERLAFPCFTILVDDLGGVLGIGFFLSI